MTNASLFLADWTQTGLLCDVCVYATTQELLIEVVLSLLVEYSLREGFDLASCERILPMSEIHLVDSCHKRVVLRLEKKHVEKRPWPFIFFQYNKDPWALWRFWALKEDLTDFKIPVRQ